MLKVKDVFPNESYTLEQLNDIADEFDFKVEETIFDTFSSGASCHVAAPRGSTTGTQGKMSYVEKAVIPQKLCAEIAQITKLHLTR